MDKWSHIRGFMDMLSYTSRRIGADVRDNVVTWEQLIPLDRKIVLTKFTRSDEVELEYREHRKSMNNDQSRIRDYILANELTDAAGTKLDHAFAFNKFPYSVEYGVFHMIFWMVAGKELSIDEVRNLIMQKLHEFDIVIFKNTPAEQSVELVPHYHVFMKRTHQLA